MAADASLKYAKLVTQIILHKKYVITLYKRLSLLKIDFAKKNDFERNEIEICEFETKEKIAKRLKLIAALENKLWEQNIKTMHTRFTVAL